jgi:hypothetical protein
MKRYLSLVLVLIFLVAFPILSKADEEDPPEVIDLVYIPEPTPVPIPMPEDPRPIKIIEHNLDEKDVERIARLIWGSPAKDRDSKVLLIWCVMNRLYEPTGYFGSSIREIVNKNEFSWFSPHDHRSQENLKLVRDTLNQYLTWRETNNNVGRHPSRRVYYIRSTEENRNVLEGSEHLNPWKTLSWVN